MKFLVWCTSYDDTEDDACSVECAPYTVLCEYTRRRITVYSLRDAAHAAEVYARYVHGQRDGWESTWPLQFRVKHCLPIDVVAASWDGLIEDFEVDREVVPEFTASRPRAARAGGAT